MGCVYVCRYGPPGSAICVYSADMSGTKDRGIFTIFSEDYRNLRPGQTSCTANSVPNDNPFTVSKNYYSNYFKIFDRIRLKADF